MVYRFNHANRRGLFFVESASTEGYRDASTALVSAFAERPTPEIQRLEGSFDPQAFRMPFARIAYTNETWRFKASASSLAATNSSAGMIPKFSGAGIRMHLVSSAGRGSNYTQTRIPLLFLTTNNQRRTILTADKNLGKPSPDKRKLFRYITLFDGK